MTQKYIDGLMALVIDQARTIKIPVSQEIAPHVRLNRRARTRFGCCIRREGRYTIELSAQLAEQGSEDAILQVLAHEVLHTCYGCSNHGARWKGYAQRMNSIYGYRIRRTEVETARRAWIEAGNAEESFAAPTDEAETRLKELFREYRRRRDAFIADLDAEKEANLQIKTAVIEELKALVGSDETLNHTFTRFRELQQRWKETGPVPQAAVKDLWETYNLHVENFYDFIKINKELRDLDLKKNHERKVALCEQAEALSDEKSIVEAFRKLQKLHDAWRETGPVANEYRESLWERFKAASSRINKLHQEHFEALKAEQLKNLELKSALCEAAEALATAAPATRKEWTRANDRLLEIQKSWKAIGFAPKKDNNRIYERFRAACNRFFELKRAYFADMKGEMEQNLLRKNALCERAEALAESEEWKQTTDELIALQAEWKQAGPVSRRHADAVWKRFRSACDRFFERKAAHFASVDDAYAQNLALKTACSSRWRRPTQPRGASRRSASSSAAGARSASCPSAARRRSRSVTKRRSTASSTCCAARSATARWAASARSSRR